MSFGSRLKEKREALNITQPQLAEMLGVSKGAIGNWETDVNSPRATLLYDLFNILHCDENYLFQDEMKRLKYKDKATPSEFENIIKKYRDLDEHGKEMVDFTLTKEWERSLSVQKTENIITMSDRTELAAAHARTDITPTFEGQAHDNAIMDDDSEWE
ncbi:MAG: helix-turn-helix transcriptional regulator [Bacillota bacterium]|nr:helix-turn-helix transcriptional regulator [Bacillota bacterium]